MIAKVIAYTIKQMGQDVVYTAPDGQNSATIRMSVQTPFSSPTVNDYDQEFALLYVGADPIPALIPEKFGSVDYGGLRRAVEDVTMEVLGGVPVAYVLRIRG